MDKDKEKIQALEQQIKQLESVVMRLAKQVQQHHGRIIRTDERLRHTDTSVQAIKRRIGNA